MKKLVIILINLLALTGCRGKQGASEILTGSTKDYFKNSASLESMNTNLNQYSKKCKDICPSDSSVLKGNTGTLNFLSFENFSTYKKGRCRGNTIVGQQFAELAQYEPSGYPNCNQTPLSLECKKTLKIKINNIFNFSKVEVFNGFNNLFELSSHPELKSLFKSKAGSYSHIYSASRIHKTQGATYLGVIKRVKAKQMPYIGIKTYSGDHAVSAIALEYKAGTQVICIRDSNDLIEHNGEPIEEDCRNYIYESRGLYYYKMEGKNSDRALSKFNLLTDEDIRVKKYISARRAYCIESKKALQQCH